MRVPHILHAFLIHYLVSCQPPAEIPAISNRAEEEEDKPSQVLLFWSPKDPFSVPSIQSTVTHQRGAVQSKSMAQGLVERGGVHSWALRSAQGRGAADPSPVCRDYLKSSYIPPMTNFSIFCIFNGLSSGGFDSVTRELNNHWQITPKGVLGIMMDFVFGGKVTIPSKTKTQQKWS